MNTVDFLVELNQRLQQDIRYLVRMEPGVQTPEETLTLPSGSCRDTAWLLVQVLRHLGLASRFVSGYLIQLKPDLKSLDGPCRRRRRISPTCTPGPKSTFRAPAGSGSIRPPACCAARGTCRSPRRRTTAPRRRSPARVEPAEVEFSFEMRIARIDEKPRVTCPFSDEAWAALDALGEKVDADLAAQDVRLTMGGEPTFVSIDDYQSAGMEHGRDRPDQARPRRRADPPAARPLCARRVAALRAGQMVSGRSRCRAGPSRSIWRNDGKPIWRNAGADRAPRRRARTPSSERCAALHRSARGAARHPTALRAAGLRGPADRMLKEGALPVNVDPSDPEDRRPA